MQVSHTEKVLIVALRACCENRLRMDTFCLFLGCLETLHFSHSRVFAKNIEVFQYKTNDMPSPTGGKKSWLGFRGNYGMSGEQKFRSRNTVLENRSYSES